MQFGDEVVADKSLAAKTISNIRFADQFSGATAGAKIVAAIADLPATGGTVDARGLEGAQTISSNFFSGVAETKPVHVILGAGTYTLTATIVKPLSSILSGSGPELTTINYTGSSAAIVIAGAPAYEDDKAQGGLYNFRLVDGNGSATAIGVYFGGDPAGVLSTSTHRAWLQQVSNVHIRNFASQFKIGNGAFGLRFKDSLSEGRTGTTHILLDPAMTLTETNENIHFEGVTLSNGERAVNGTGLASPFQNLTFVNSSIDYTGVSTTSSFLGVGGTFTNCHFEQQNGLLFDDDAAQVNIRIFGGAIHLSDTSGTTAAAILLDGPGSKVEINGTVITTGTGHTVTQVVNATGAGTSAVLINTSVDQSTITALINSGETDGNYLIHNPKTAGAVEGGLAIGASQHLAGGTNGPPTLSVVAPVTGRINIVLSDSLTDSVTKAGRIGMQHYTNSEEPAAVFTMQSDSTDNVLTLGGGSGMNAATEVRIRTGATGTTLSGTDRWRFTATGIMIPALDDTYDIGRITPSNLRPSSLYLSKRVVSGLSTVTFSATPTFDGSLGNSFKITLTGNVTSSTFSNAQVGQQISFLICQDSTGNRTFVWPANVKGGVTIGTVLSTCSAQTFLYDGTNAYALSSGVTGM